MNFFGLSETVAETVWRVSWQASVLVLVVLLVQWLFGKRLPPGCRHALWLVVLARLILPAAPESAFSVFNYTRLPIQTGRAQPDEILGQAAKTDLAGQLASAEDHERIDWTASVAAGSLPREPVTVRQLLACVWWAGFAGLALRLALGSVLLIRKLRRACPMANPAAASLLAECARGLGLKRAPALVEFDGIDSPALFGMFRPKLLLPPGTTERMSHEELRHIFLHECAHVRRGDVALNWVMAVVQAFHWFNPLVWFAFHRMRAERELACDALALKQAGEDCALSYGETILKLLENSVHPRPLPGLVGIVEDKQQIKERILMIAQFRTTQRRPLLALAAVAALALISLTDAQTEKPASAAPATPADSGAPAERLEVPNPLVLTDRNQEDATKLFTRTFRVNPAVMVEWRPVNAPEGELEPSRRPLDVLRQFLSAAGVDFAMPAPDAPSLLSLGRTFEHAPVDAAMRVPDASGRAYFYNHRTGILFARATLEELEKIEKALQVFNTAPPQVVLEVKVAEISAADTKALGFDWFLGNRVPQDRAPGEQDSSGVEPSQPSAGAGIFPGSPPAEQPGAVAPGTITGILTDPQLRLVVRALEQRRGVDVLAFPRVTTLSGRQAEVSIEDGSRVELLPEVQADGFSIRVKARYSSGAKAGGGQSAIDTTVILWDGQTIVLGGLDHEDAAGQKKRILVFVTATIVDPAGNRIRTGDAPYVP